MARMRYIHQALAELKKSDPDTPITEYYLRRLVATGAVPFVKVGRRRLINFDALLAYLETANDGEPPLQSGSNRQNAG